MENNLLVGLFRNKRSVAQKMRNLIFFLFILLIVLYKPARALRPYYLNIETETLENTAYRRVLYTTSNMQLVLMSLAPGEEIGQEQHPHTSQFIRVEAGHGLAIIDNKRYCLSDGMIVVIPPNAPHNIINTSAIDLKFYTIYTPPEHPPSTLHQVIQDKQRAGNASSK